MSRRHARSISGERAIGKVQEARGKQTTITGVIGTEGILCWDRIQGGMNQFKFASYIENVLSKVWEIENYLVIDNLSSHKTELVIRTLEKYKIKYIYLPPYYPDLNPIELFWSVFKNLLKSLEARTKDNLFACIHEVFRRLKDLDPIPLFKKCGYFLLELVKTKTAFDLTEILDRLTYRLNTC